MKIINYSSVFSNLILTLVLTLTCSAVSIGYAADPTRPGVAPKPLSDEFMLGGERFSTAKGIDAKLVQRLERTAKSRTALSGEAQGKAHIIVQFHKAMSRKARESFAERGVQILNRINANTWVASTDAKGVEALIKEKEVRWADLYPITAKISQDIQEDKPSPWQQREDGRIAYSVLFHKDVTAAEARRLQETMSGLSLEHFDAKAFSIIRMVTVVIRPGDLKRLAEADIIRWIEAEDEPHVPTNQANTQPLSNVNDVQVAPYNLSGTGVTVGVWEANEPGTNGIVRNTHQELTGRTTLAADQVLPAPPVYSYHATHVAGTIASSGANTPAAEGMAPAASLVSWGSANDAAEMTSAATSAGGVGDPVPIVISNHSYGFDRGWSANGTGFSASAFTRFGQYRNNSAAYDTVVRAADLTAVFAAGNERNDQWDGATVIPGITNVPGGPAITRDCTQGGFAVDADCISSTGTAKNIITVGAMNGAGAIANFSSFGPTDDGRIKPDIMAHGVAVTSLRNSSNTATGPKSGTSMASPAVAGMAALLTEQATTLGLTLKPAAIKALLLQSAQDVNGVGQTTLGPDFATGWGIADVQAAADLLRLPAGAGLAQETITNTGAANAYTHSFYVPAGQPELHVTLVWSDPAGDPTTPSGAQLVNDLDLRLIAPDDTVTTPWSLNPAAPGNAAVRNGGDDTVNNVEQVSVLNPAEGVWTARVSAKAGSLVAGPQDFALAGPLTPAAGPIASTKADVMMVLDRSGSMSLSSSTPGINKLEALQGAANEFLDFMELVGGHQVGLVQFDTNVAPFVPPFDLQPLDGASVGNAHTAVDGMTSGNWTNIIDGVTTAQAQLSGPAAANPEKVVFLFSDGKHNRPVGSNVADIDTIMAANTRFYAIGYGTDVDSTVMPGVATNHDGLYLEEQTLSAGQLSKLFLTIAGLTVNEDVVIDPDYMIAPGKSAQQRVVLTRSDRSVTFATHWNDAQGAEHLRTQLVGPDKQCNIATRDHSGYATRAGERYRLIRVELPYRCDKSGTLMHAGEWSLLIANRGAQQESASVMVLADSSLDFESSTKIDGHNVYLMARFLVDGKVVRGKQKIFAAISKPIESTNDSEKQDRGRKHRFKTGFEIVRPKIGTLKQGMTLKTPTPMLGLEPTQIMKLPKTHSGVIDANIKGRLQTITARQNQVAFVDDGTNGDAKAGDGTYTAALRLSDKGFYQVRIVGQLGTENGTVSREAMAGFLMK